MREEETKEEQEDGNGGEGEKGLDSPSDFGPCAFSKLNEAAWTRARGFGSRFGKTFYGTSGRLTSDSLEADLEIKSKQENASRARAPIEYRIANTIHIRARLFTNIIKKNLEDYLPKKSVKI